MPKPVAIGIFFHRRASAAFGLLAASTLRSANRVDAAANLDVRLLGEGDSFDGADCTIRLDDWAAGPIDYLVIPPMEGFRQPTEDAALEADRLRQVHQSGTSLAAACLGSFLLADAGLLDGREATTHWNRTEFALEAYPSVRWNTREMLIDHGDIITAGGLLSIVDLCLHIIRKSAGPDCAAQVGRHLLADTVRQKQSVYATRLVAPPRDDGIFARLEKEIERRAGDNLTVADMAEICAMSLRSFHRRFQQNYGVSPVKYLQLRRVERAKAMLAETTLPLDDIAEAAGFGDMAFFRTVFARETGLTPGQFRRRLAI